MGQSGNGRDIEGVKLNLQSQISSYLIGDREFLVIVPFVKKDRQQRHRVEASETITENPNPDGKLATELADSTWSEIMQDLLSFQDVSNLEHPHKAEFKSMNSENENTHDKRTSPRRKKRKKELNTGLEEGSSDDVLLSILQASSKNMVDKDNLKKLLEFMEYSSCLTNPATGSCVMREANDQLDGESDPCKSRFCLCPLWLKDIMRLWRKQITISALKGPLDELRKFFGFHPGIEDFEVLSQVCPQELANLPTVELIEKDGSPSALKLFMLWNPPLRLKTVWRRTKSSLEAKKSVSKDVVAGRSSPILEVSYLLAEMVQHGLRCIAFCKTRKLCELVLCYTREILHKSAPHLADKVYAYRGGYIAEDRRRIESDFFNGSICGIAATNALELGIDVGHIDATLHLGFPGSIASLWQQAGRSGRREKTSLAIYVAFEGPLDQYFMKFPHKLFRGPIECCHVDPNNEQVLQQHLLCAALEHPLSLPHDEKYFGPGLESAFMRLKSKGCLSTDLSRDAAARIWTYIGHEKSPSRAVNVRAIETVRYKVIEKTKNEVLEEIEESKAFFQVYEGAVYMNQGKTYLVKHLDLSSKIAWCQQADVNYYTKTRDSTDIHVIGGDIAYPASITNDQFQRTSAQTHICKVTTTWFGFRRIWRRSNQVFDTVELSLPDYSYESQAVWIRVPQSVKTAVETSQYCFHGGLHAAGHALLNVVPLFIICNQSDLASECANPHDSRYVPERILLYDPHPGGTGISKKVQPLFMELLTAALELLSSCHCSGDAGCPNCVQNLACSEYNEVLTKMRP
ncbi:ATP-dependent helicase hrq1 [Sesamum angolense]|uniref:ATP-dependent helicase hrq1 n=1 Tax=Sesamum angolense TaxID=2727404 RepID=A0AAE2BS34_9LAMI|nr:ATP-dependent helicase hrq1 [Sesamum angolense]